MRSIIMDYINDNYNNILKQRSPYIDENIEFSAQRDARSADLPK